MNKDKEDIIKLFKAFLSDESFPIIKGKRTGYDKNVAFYCTANYDDSTEVEYRYGSKEFSNSMKALYNYPFEAKGEAIPNISTIVTLYLDSHPPIELYESIRGKQIGDEEEDVLYGYKRVNAKSWVERNLEHTHLVSMYKYENETIRYIKFGSLKIDLSKEDFDELHEFFKEKLAVRPNQLDRAKLKKNLRTYNLKTKI